MFDTSRALADMAQQIRQCRSAEGLTLQQLATRSGVAASTIHKVEARQMVPTVSVLLKIAKGLGRRPDELIRDEAAEVSADPTSGDARATGEARSTTISLGSRQHGGRMQAAAQSGGARAMDQPDAGSAFAGADSPSQPGNGHVRTPHTRPDVGVWELDLPPGHTLPALELEATQRAIVLVQSGEIELDTGGQQVRMDTGDCVEVEGGRFRASGGPSGPARMLLIVSPRGAVETRLGEASPSAPIFG